MGDAPARAFSGSFFAVAFSSGPSMSRSGFLLKWTDS